MRVIRFQARPNCPACNSTDVKPRYRCPFGAAPISNYLQTFYGREPPELLGDYCIDECLACGTYFQSEIGTDEGLATFYTWLAEAELSTKDPHYIRSISRPWASRDGHEILAASSYLGVQLTQLATLDYGMGWGEWARVSKSLGCQSYGHDLAPQLVQAAARYGIEPHTDQLYHFINTEQVLEHVADPAETVGYLASCLLPGGILKVSVPSARGAEAVLGKLAAGQAFTNREITPIAPVEHLNCFTMTSLEGLGRRSGLEPVKPSYGHRYAFLRHRHTLGTSLGHAAKELVRPWVQWRNPGNLYLWLRRPPL